MTEKEEKMVAEAIYGIAEALKSFDARLRTIEETREPQKKVPQPLTEVLVDACTQDVVLFVTSLASRGLGIYRIKDIEEACK